MGVGMRLVCLHNVYVHVVVIFDLHILIEAQGTLFEADVFRTIVKSFPVLLTVQTPDFGDEEISLEAVMQNANLDNVLPVRGQL